MIVLGEGGQGNIFVMCKYKGTSSGSSIALYFCRCLTLDGDPQVYQGMIAFILSARGKERG